MCAHVALLNGNAGRHVGERSDTRLLESRVPNVLEGRALGVGENEREDLVGVRLQERVDLLQVSLNSSAIEQELAANQLTRICSDEQKWALTQSVWQKWRTPSLLYHENQHDILPEVRMHEHMCLCLQQANAKAELGRNVHPLISSDWRMETVRHC